MPRRVRRSGMRFIKNERGRSLTFFKRRAGLFKTAADLSTLTGARTAVVLESENGKISSFGTPSVVPIVDAFLSGFGATEPSTNQGKRAKITILQNKLFKKEKEKAVEEKRKKEAMVRVKEVQESSPRMGKLIFNKEDDLDTNELYELIHKLSPIMQEIKHRSSRLSPGNKVGVGGLRNPQQCLSSWPHLMPTQIQPPSRHSLLAPSKQHLHRGQPIFSRSMVVRSQPSFPTSVALPSSLLQAQMMPNYPYNYRIWGKYNSTNNLGSSSQSSPLLPSPQFPLVQSLDSKLPHPNVQNNNWVKPPQNYAGQVNFDLRNTGENGGQASGVRNSGLLQSNNWVEAYSNSSSPGESSSCVDVNFPLY